MGSENGLKTIYPEPEVLRVEELYFCHTEPSYSAYICESCYWCNCIEVLTTICSPLGGPGSSCRQWSGYVQHITAHKEKKLPFQIFPTAANKIQMSDAGALSVSLPHYFLCSFSRHPSSSGLLHLFSNAACTLLVHPSTLLIIYFLFSSTFTLLAPSLLLCD